MREKPEEVEKILEYLKELLAQREKTIEVYSSPIMMQALQGSTELQIAKIKVDTEIALLKDEITAIEKLV